MPNGRRNKMLRVVDFSFDFIVIE